MISLEGLTPMQQNLAQRIWEIEDQAQLTEFVQSLPRSVARQAYVVIQLMLLAAIDQEELGDMQEAHDVIERIRAC
jgi:uncharacterized membrane protein